MKILLVTVSEVVVEVELGEIDVAVLFVEFFEDFTVEDWDQELLTV